jgi:hypothetical protein
VSAPSSADRLYEKLALNPGALGAYRDDVTYMVQVETTRKLLDVVDEVTDSFTAGLITDAICERFTGDGASEASQRMRERQAELERLMREPPLPMYFLPRTR